MSKDLQAQLKNMDRSALEAALSVALLKQEDTQKRLDEALLEIELLKDMLRLKSRLAFIPSTEQFSLLFDEAEILSEDLTDEQDAMIEIPAHERRKHKKHDLAALPADTPVQEVYHYDEGRQEFCDRCESPLVAKEDRVVYQVEVVPKSYTILAHHYRSWACSACEADEGEQNIITEWENKETDTLIASSSLVAECAVRKYADGLPLYRQEAIFRREGLQFSRQTISNWLLTYMGLLAPLRRQFEKRIQKLLQCGILESYLSGLHFLSQSERMYSEHGDSVCQIMYLGLVLYPILAISPILVLLQVFGTHPCPGALGLIIVVIPECVSEGAVWELQVITEDRKRQIG